MGSVEVMLCLALATHHIYCAILRKSCVSDIKYIYKPVSESFYVICFSLKTWLRIWFVLNVAQKYHELKTTILK